jgi:uncharacterized protein (TIGR03067 family)
MRNTISLFLTISCAGLISLSATKAQQANLNGTWIPVKQEIGGQALPAASYAKETLTLIDTLYTVMAESADKGTVKYNGDKLDIYGKDGPNAGKHFTALYKLENGQLTVCYNLKGDSYPDGFVTAGKPLYFLSVFKKSSGN